MGVRYDSLETEKFRDRVRAAVTDCLVEEPEWIFVSVNPDLRGEGGHYLYLDERLRAAAGARKGGFVSLSSKVFALPPAWVAPVLTQPTQPYSEGFSFQDRVVFAQEIEHALREILDIFPTGRVLAFLYSGHAHQLPLVCEAMSRINDARLDFAFNLYSAYFNFDEDSVEYARDALVAECALRFCSGLNLAHQVRVVGDADYASGLISRHMSREDGILPFFSVAKPSKDLVLKASTGSASDGEITVVYLSHASEERGFSLLLDSVQCCKSARPDIRWRFRFRTAKPVDAAMHGESGEEIRRLMAEGVEIIHGFLPDYEMTALYESADIVLCPYRKRVFGSRTSANVSDAIAYGKPVVATADTWAGRLVDEMNFGATFRDGDGADLGKAILRVVESLDEIRTDVVQRGEEWLKANNPSAVLDFLLNFTYPSVTQQAEVAQIEWERLTCGIFNSFLSGLMVALANGLDPRDSVGQANIDEVFTRIGTSLRSDKLDASLHEALVFSVRLQELNQYLYDRVATLEGQAARYKAKSEERRKEIETLKKRSREEIQRLKKSFHYKPWKKLFFMKG